MKTRRWFVFLDRFRPGFRIKVEKPFVKCNNSINISQKKHCFCQATYSKCCYAGKTIISSKAGKPASALASSLC